MPPKTKDKDDKVDLPTKADSSKDISREPDPQPGPSTSTDSPKRETHLRADRPPPSAKDITKSPVCRLASDKIFERGVEEDPVVAEVKRLQDAREPFEKILMFHLGRKRFSDAQRKSWINIINKKRLERSMSSIPTDYETRSPLKFTDEDISKFCDTLDKDEYWDAAKSKEPRISETQTSSDSEIESEMKSPKIPLRRSPRHRSKIPSWKEFKKGKNFASAYIKEPVEHSGVKKVLQKVVKAIWKKKKQHYVETNKLSSIEVGKDEVQNVLFKAVGFMERRYINHIKASALHIYSSEDSKFESECESGSYDSQDDWFPHNETEGSRIKKMSVSVSVSTLKACGLLDILIATLPMTLNYNDPTETLEFVEVLKMAKNRAPEQTSLRNTPTKSKAKKKQTSASTVVCKAFVEPPPDLERLEKTGAKDYMKQLPTQDDEESETQAISNGVKHHLQLEPKETEPESSLQVGSAEVSEGMKIIDESSMQADSTEESEGMKIIDESSMQADSTEDSEGIKIIDESSMQVDSTEVSEGMKFIDESSTEETEDIKPLEGSEQVKRSCSPGLTSTPSKKKTTD